MPDTKFSFPMLREHLRKWWFFYILGVIVICFFNNLIFTVTRPRVPEENTVRIMLLNAYADDQSLDAYAAELTAALQAEEREVQLVRFEKLVGTSDQYSDMVVAVKLTDGYSDLFITDAAGFESLAQKGACMPLDEYVMPDDPRAVSCTDLETGDAYTGGLSVKLFNSELFPQENAILVISSGTTNFEDTLAALELLIDGESR